MNVSTKDLVQEKSISSTRRQCPRTYGEACFESTTSLARNATLHATQGMNSALQDVQDYDCGMRFLLLVTRCGKVDENAIVSLQAFPMYHPPCSPLY